MALKNLMMMNSQRTRSSWPNYVLLTHETALSTHLDSPSVHACGLRHASLHKCGIDLGTTKVASTYDPHMWRSKLRETKLTGPCMMSS